MHRSAGQINFVYTPMLIDTSARVSQIQTCRWLIRLFYLVRASWSLGLFRKHRLKIIIAFSHRQSAYFKLGSIRNRRRSIISSGQWEDDLKKQTSRDCTQHVDSKHFSVSLCNYRRKSTDDDEIAGWYLHVIFVWKIAFRDMQLQYMFYASNPTFSSRLSIVIRNFCL